MINDFRCDNEECEEFDKVKENIEHKSDETPVCEKCGETMEKVWRTSGGIRTSDGYKS